MVQTRRNADREARWRKIVGGYSGGGMSIRAYCRSRGVNEAAFYWWRRELVRRDSVKTSPVFLPVVVESSAEGVEAIKAGDCGAPDRLEGVVLELAGGRRLKMPSLSLGQVLELIRVIEGAQ